MGVAQGRYYCNLKSFTCALCRALDSVGASDITAFLCDIFYFIQSHLHQRFTSSKLHNLSAISQTELQLCLKPSDDKILIVPFTVRDYYFTFSNRV